MAYTRDPRVDAYIDAIPAWQQRVCREVRDLRSMRSITRRLG